MFERVKAWFMRQHPVLKIIAVAFVIVGVGTALKVANAVLHVF